MLYIANGLAGCLPLRALGLLLNTVKGSEHILEHAKLWTSLALAFGGEMYALFAAHEIHLARLSLERLKNIFKGLDYRFVPPHLGAHDGARASFNVGSLVPVSLVSAWGVLPAFAVDWLSAGARPWLPLLSVGLAAVAANLILRHSPDAWQRFLLSALIFVILAAPLVIVDYWRGRVPWSLVRFALLTVAVMIVELAVGFQKRRMPRGLLQWLKSWRSGERSADKESNGHPEPSKDDKAA